MKQPKRFVFTIILSAFVVFSLVGCRDMIIAQETNIDINVINNIIGYDFVQCSNSFTATEKITDEYSSILLTAIIDEKALSTFNIELLNTYDIHNNCDPLISFPPGLEAHLSELGITANTSSMRRYYYREICLNGIWMPFEVNWYLVNNDNDSSDLYIIASIPCAISDLPNVKTHEEIVE